MKINYRSEIDGLRAIAVIAVIFYHSKMKIFGHEPFQGGFIGVDIFFVISGYLISSIILKELFTTGSFSFKYFFERRIRRILPVLLLVMFASLPVAWIYLLPSVFEDFSKSILYSLGFNSNFYFHFSGQEYGGVSGLHQPFLHTWSLSVEEQYYIIFPLVLLITFKYIRKYLIHVLIISFLISLGLSDWGSKNYTSATFYFLHTRIWELLAGSILAYFEITLGYRGRNKTLKLTLPISGLILIVYSILFFNDEMRHPSIYTITPIVGVCLIIWFSNSDEIIGKILGSKLFVGIGLISYSLYLWHYPIFAFARITYFTESSLFKELFLVIVILTLSIVTYYLIERPARNKKFKFKNIFSLIMIFFFSILIFNIFVVLKNGVKDRYKDNYSEIYIKNNIFNKELSSEVGKYLEKFKNQKFQSSDKIKVLIIGNSHSENLFSALVQNKDLFKKYQFLQKSYNFGKNQKNNERINFQNNIIFKQADVILISNYFLDEESFDNLENFINYFKNKKKIILTSNSNIYYSKYRFKKLYNLTLFDYYLLKNREKKKFIDKDLSSNDIYQINNYYFNLRIVRKIKSINKRLEKISKKYNIKILYKQNFQCLKAKKICYGVSDEGMKIYWDTTHYTLKGANFFGKKIYELNWLNLD